MTAGDERRGAQDGAKLAGTITLPDSLAWGDGGGGPLPAASSARPVTAGSTHPDTAGPFHAATVGLRPLNARGRIVKIR